MPTPTPSTLPSTTMIGQQQQQFIPLMRPHVEASHACLRLRRWAPPLALRSLMRPCSDLQMISVYHFLSGTASTHDPFSHCEPCSSVSLAKTPSGPCLTPQQPLSHFPRQRRRSLKRSLASHQTATAQAPLSVQQRTRSSNLRPVVRVVAAPPLKLERVHCHRPLLDRPREGEALERVVI
jgi:hypothetical protein